MNEPEPSYGTVTNACAYLSQMAGAVIVHANLVQEYVEIGFRPGLDYSVRCLRAYLRALDQAYAEVERSRAVESYRKSAENIGPGQGV